MAAGNRSPSVSRHLPGSPRPPATRLRHPRCRAGRADKQAEQPRARPAPSASAKRVNHAASQPQLGKRVGGECRNGETGSSCRESCSERGASASRDTEHVRKTDCHRAMIEQPVGSKRRHVSSRGALRRSAAPPRRCRDDTHRRAASLGARALRRGRRRRPHPARGPAIGSASPDQPHLKAVRAQPSARIATAHSTWHPRRLVKSRMAAPRRPPSTRALFYPGQSMGALSPWNWQMFGTKAAVRSQYEPAATRRRKVAARPAPPCPSAGCRLSFARQLATQGKSATSAIRRAGARAKSAALRIVAIGRRSTEPPSGNVHRGRGGFAGQERDLADEGRPRAIGKDRVTPLPIRYCALVSTRVQRCVTVSLRTAATAPPRPRPARLIPFLAQPAGTARGSSVRMARPRPDPTGDIRQVGCGSEGPDRTKVPGFESTTRNRARFETERVAQRMAAPELGERPHRARAIAPRPPAGQQAPASSRTRNPAGS